MDRSRPLSLSPADLRRALRDLDPAIEQDPANVVAHYCRALAYNNLGAHNHALCGFDQVLALDPHLVQAHFGRAVARHGLGEYRRAIRAYGRVIELDPDYAPAYLCRGLARGLLREHWPAIGDIKHWEGIHQGYEDRRALLVGWGETARAIAHYHSLLLMLEKDSVIAIENHFLALPLHSSRVV